jgi:hypothetical protein
LREQVKGVALNMHEENFQSSCGKLHHINTTKKDDISRGGEIMGVAMEPTTRGSTPFPDSGGAESQNSSSSCAKRQRRPQKHDPEQTAIA